MRPRTYDAAVLFVHGIGDQHRGDTLDEFGGSLITRARQWLGADSVRDLPSAVQDGSDAPLHRAVEVDRPGREPLRLLLAESHWADEVQAPRWGVLMRWLAGTVPFIVQRAADASMRRLSRNVDDLARGLDAGPLATVARVLLLLVVAAVRVAANVLAVGLALTVVLLLLVLGLLARLEPIRDACFGNGPSRPFARWAQILAVVSLVPIVLLARSDGPPAVALAVILSALPAVVLLSLAGRVRSLVVSFVGDSYALLDESGAGIVARVEHDLTWLQGRAGSAPVVIVAHSQGAEVAHRMLAARSAAATAPVESLVTFGAGIAKLHATDMLRRRRWLSTSAFGLRAASAACACAGSVAVAGRWDTPLAPYGGPALLLIAAGLLTGARAILRTVVGDEAQAIRIDSRAVAHWSDLHASHDPVSEGILPIPQGLGHSQTIVNRRSLVLDHVTYWSNVEGFQSLVALEIERAADGRAAVTVPDALTHAALARARSIDRIFMLHAGSGGLAVALSVMLAPGVLWTALIVLGGVLHALRWSKVIYADVARHTDALVTARGVAPAQRSSAHAA